MALHLLAPPKKSATKRERIITLFLSGLHDITELANMVQCRPSYVAQVLQSENLIQGYFDLYTSTGIEQNVYSPFFRNVLSFKNLEAARQSIQKLDRLYEQFERVGDRSGQHHALMLALVGKNRARWSGKIEESRLFHDWLCSH